MKTYIATGFSILCRAFTCRFFFLLSGFVYKFKGSYGSYLWKKTKRILIPYLIFTLIDMIPRYFMGFLFNRQKNIWESVKDMLFFGGAKWFLYVLFIIFLIYPAIYLLHKGSKRKILLIIEAVLLVAAVIGINTDWFRIGSVVYYIFYFHTGLLIRSYYSEFKEWFDNRSAVTVILISVFTLVLWCLCITFIPEEWHRWLRIIPAFLGILTCYSLTKWFWFNKAFLRFGKYSLQIYLLNSWMLGLSRYLICSLLGVTFPPVIIVVNMLVDFGLSYLLIKYVLQRFKVFRFALGMI